MDGSRPLTSMVLLVRAPWEPPASCTVMTSHMTATFGRVDRINVVHIRFSGGRRRFRTGGSCDAGAGPTVADEE